MKEIDKEKFIKDIKKDLGIQERKQSEEYKLETFDNFDDVEEIYASFFGGGSSGNKTSDLDNPNNVTIEYNVNSKVAKNKHKKTFKYRINNNGVMENKKIEIEIPAYIRTGQIILVRGEGNKDRNTSGNLIIKIHLKHEC